MSNRIDQLFKNLLGEHKVQPSAHAWEKVQAGLTKKNNNFFVWRVAASLILFGAIISAWYFLNSDETTRPIQLANTKETVSPQNENKKITESIPTQVKSDVAHSAKEATSKKRNKNVVENPDSQNSTTEYVAMESMVVQKDLQENIIEAESNQITPTTTPEKPIVIEFTLESVFKTPITEVAQTNQEENYGLKKILDAARDVKNGDSDLGIIRDTKNQLFALDFRKDKIKRN
jgi:hypothetical protein